MFTPTPNSPVLLHPDAPSPGTDRTLAILELLGRHRLGLSLTEIARDLSLPANSVSRITDTLTARGYLQRREDNRRFVLTHKLFDLSRPHVRERSLVVCALEALKWLRDTTGETTQLLCPIGTKVTVLEQCISSQPIKVSSTIGHQAPMYSCAPGKAILAEWSDLALTNFLSQVTLKPFTPTTLADPARLRSDLKTSHRRGYATDLAEGLEGIHCVAAAVLDDYNCPVAAVTVMAPAFRLKKERFTEVSRHCIAAASQIQQRLLA